MDVTILTGTIEDAISVERRIPEFLNPYPLEEYERRLTKPHLILIAHADGRNIGYKVGYDRTGDKRFYSWIGGVHPAYRKHGVAQKLQDEQETWAKENGYHTLWLKTKNKFSNMIRFSVKNGFYITSLEPQEKTEDNVIVMEKKLIVL